MAVRYVLRLYFKYCRGRARKYLITVLKTFFIFAKYRGKAYVSKKCLRKKTYTATRARVLITPAGKSPFHGLWNNDGNGTRAGVNLYTVYSIYIRFPKIRIFG